MTFFKFGLLVCIFLLCRTPWFHNIAVYPFYHRSLPYVSSSLDAKPAKFEPTTVVKRNATKLMKLNHIRATSNFGSSMDNMTLVLAYIFPNKPSTDSSSSSSTDAALALE